MGIVTLTIIKGTDLINMTTGSVRKPGNLTHKTTYWERSVTNTRWGDQKAAADIKFKLNMTNIRFDKKMYSPNEIVADIQLSVECAPDKIRKAFISKNDLDTIFVNKKVKLECDETIVCDDYYVHEVIPRRYKDEMWVTLKIYSPDKLMTLKPGCSAFVAQELSSIVEKEKNNYAIPYLTTYKQNEKGEMVIDTTTPVGIDSSNMQNLKQVKDGATSEHIFPYLVQYNESFYDFLARTANRWGEFMYYESNKLNIGNTAPAATTSTKDSISGYSLLTWHNLADKEFDDKTTYASEAPYDNNILNSVITKGEYDAVKGTIFNDADNGADSFWMGKVAQLFGNDKPLAQFTTDGLVDDLVAYFQTLNRVNKNNDTIDSKYFLNSQMYNDSNLKAPYGLSDGKWTFNQFSENTPIVNASTYTTILKGELDAGKNAIKVEYDTMFPELKLGSVITFESKQYIVIEVEGYQPEIIKQDNNGNYEHVYKTSEVRYRITAIAAQGTAFYPMMLPSGHIRKSGPKIAVVVDVDDPLRCNRVRVKFPWQLTTFNKDYEKISADDLKNQTDTQKAESTPSPWLIYASASGPKGAGIHGRHYLAEKVLVDFADGNVERPYVVGAVSRDVPGGVKTGSAVLAAPNGESIKVHEGTGLGVAAFLGSMNPGLKFIRGFVGPFGQDIIWKNNEACLEGGVDISDKYGIWSIKGSTHDRNISIKSPWGDVKIDAFTGITISAPNGDVKISGKNVSIEAGNNLTLTSGKNIKNQLFPSLGKGAKVWGEELGLQAAAVLTTKLFPMVIDVFDLSLLRKMFEVFFRPDEGLLEIKSNRFLKLESGKGNAKYPDEAYYDRSKMVIAANKERSTSSAKPYYGRYLFWEYNEMVPDVLKLFKQISNHIKDYSDKLLENYNIAINKKENMDTKLNNLRLCLYTDKSDPNAPEDAIAKDNYNKLLLDAWNQDVNNIVELEDSDLKFVDGVSLDPKTIATTHPNANDQEKDELIKAREKGRKEMVSAVNDLRKVIRDLKIKAEEEIALDKVKDVFLGVKSYGFPSETIKNLVKTVHADTFKKIGEFTDDEKKLKKRVTNPKQFREKERKLVGRKLAMSLLDELGFEDARVPIAPDVVPPLKPIIDDDITDDTKWNAYVNSIKKVPDITFYPNNDFVKKNVKMLNQQWDKFAFWRSMSEWRSWGDNAKGDILYSSDSKTYKLGDTNPQLRGHSSGYLDEEDLIQDYQNNMVEIRRILNGL